MPQQKSHHKSVFTSQPKGDRETEHQDHRNRMQYWALPSNPFFLSSVAFLCCKKKKTKEFCPNLFLLMLTLSWDILICPVHIWTSAHPIWVFHWKKNLTCSRGICWFVREQSKEIKGAVPETDEIRGMVSPGCINPASSYNKSVPQWTQSISWTHGVRVHFYSWEQLIPRS